MTLRLYLLNHDVNKKCINRTGSESHLYSILLLSQAVLNFVILSLLAATKLKEGRKAFPSQEPNSFAELITIWLVLTLAPALISRHSCKNTIHFNHDPIDIVR